MNATHHAPPQGWRATLATALCALATITSLGAMSGLVGGGAWRAPLVVLILVVAGAIAAVRAVTRSPWLPSVVGIVVGFVAVLLRYGAPPGRLQLVPDLESWDRVVAQWGEALRVIDESVVPVDVSRPLELVLAVGSLAVLVSADLLVVALGMTAWSGLAFAAMWTPTVVLGFPARGSALFWTGLVYLLLLALSVAPRSHGEDRARRAGLSTAAAVGVLGLALVVGPVLTALPGWSSWGLPSFGSGTPGSVDLSSELDVRSNLGNRSGQTVLRYRIDQPDPADGTAIERTDVPSPSPSTAPRTSAGTVGPLRAFTLTSFDGRSWRPDVAGDTLPIDPATLLSTDPALYGQEPDPSRGTVASVDVEVGALEDQQLPIATFARTLDAAGAWGWDPERDTVEGPDATQEGMRYRMLVEIPDLTADELENAPVGQSDPRALDVPASSHAADIAALAREITRDATTPYEQAMALQTYLRSAVNFTYDTRVDPPRTDDAVWDFLESRRGYCVQFATAMTVMARSLGIPARMGVGFLPGTPDDGDYVVTGKQSHAWPELAFEGYGWVRFEPTPAVQTGAPPVWSDPFANAAPAPTQDAVPTAVPRAPSTATPEGGSGQSAGNGEEEGSAALPVAITVLATLGLAGLVLAGARRRGARDADLTPEHAWAQVRKELARHGVRWGGATTPRAAVASVGAQVDTWGTGGLGAPAIGALESLARAVELDRYAPQPGSPDPGLLAQWVDSIRTGARAAAAARGATRRGRRRASRDGAAGPQDAQASAADTDPTAATRRR